MSDVAVYEGLKHYCGSGDLSSFERDYDAWRWVDSMTCDKCHGDGLEASGHTYGPNYPPYPPRKCYLCKGNRIMHIYITLERTKRGLLDCAERIPDKDAHLVLPPQLIYCQRCRVGMLKSEGEKLAGWTLCPSCCKWKRKALESAKSTANRKHGRKTKCTNCGGSGSIKGLSKSEPCQTCGGSGSCYNDTSNFVEQYLPSNYHRNY